MRQNRITTSLVGFLCVLLALIWAADETSADEGSLGYVPGELLVKFESGVGRVDRATVLNRQGARVLRHLPLVDAYQVKIDEHDPVPAAVERFAADPRVRSSQPNYLYRAFDTSPNDPLFGNLWGLHNTGQTGGLYDADVDAPEGWDLSTGSPGVVVCVIDSGVDYTHPDLAPNMWTNPGEVVNGVDDDGNGYVDDMHGINAITGTGDPMDDNTHGTHCAGTIAAAGNNGQGVAGVTWSSRIMACKFLNQEGDGDTTGAIQCIEYALSKGAHVLSNSWGGYGVDAYLKEAIDQANRMGVLFVAAAGNSGINIDILPVYPAAFESGNIITVAATDHNDELAYVNDGDVNWGSNRGVESVDVGAPGVSIFSTFLPLVHKHHRCHDDDGDGYGFCEGTSMACPHVAGLVALMRAVFPAESHLAIKSRILRTVDRVEDLDGEVLSRGRINAYKALTHPIIHYMEPNYGTSGSVVTLAGDGFGPAPGSVTFPGGSTATVLGWTNTLIRCRVPSGVETGEVTVTKEGRTSNGAHFLADPETPPMTWWYFAEGTTMDYPTATFDEYISIVNPNEDISFEYAYVTVIFMKPDGSKIVHDIAVAPRKRETIVVKDIVQSDVSVKLVSTNGVPVFAERTQYWSSGAYARVGGHCSGGTNAPATAWFFAEGSTGTWYDEPQGGVFDTYILIMNPSETAPAVARVTFMGPTGILKTIDVEVSPHTRSTIDVRTVAGDQQHIAAKVESINGVPIVAERTMYWSNDAAGVARSGGHCTAGVTEPRSDWFFAEGSTGDWSSEGQTGQFAEYITIVNPEDRSTGLWVHFLNESGHLKREYMTMAARSRLTIDVKEKVGEQTQVAVKIKADRPVVAERSMYWSNRDFKRVGGHCTVGITEPLSTRWYLAEGSTAQFGWGGFEEWVLVMNPNTLAANIRISFWTQDGWYIPPMDDFILPGNTRFTLNVNSIEDVNEKVGLSVMVESVYGSGVSDPPPIIVERAMYWDTGGVEKIGGHASLGFPRHLEDPWDLDGDGHCTPPSPACLCAGWDCDDSDPSIHTGELEVPDGVDNNCVDGIDEDYGRELVWDAHCVGLLPLGGGNMAWDMAVDSLGNAYVTGTGGWVEQSGNYLTIKYDPYGNELWKAWYDGPGHQSDQAAAIEVDASGNVYVTGESEGEEYYPEDYATVKYDTDGNQVWVARYDGPQHETDQARDIAVDPWGNVYVTGQSAQSSSPGGDDYVTIKYSPNGEELWTARYDGTNGWTDGANAMALDESGNVYVTGFSSGIGYDYATVKYDTDGNQVWVARYNNLQNDTNEATAIAVDHDGCVYVTGYSDVGAYDWDYTTVKYDPYGNEVWAMAYAGPGNGQDEPVAIAVDPIGDVVVTGKSEGLDTAEDFATIKYDGMYGIQIWERRYNGPGNDSDEAMDMALDVYGNIYVTGISGILAQLQGDFATLEYDPQGNLVWEARYKSPNSLASLPSAIAVDAYQNVYVAGWTAKPLSFDYTTIMYSNGALRCVDHDGDGYGDPASLLCPYPSWDCDDWNEDANPGEDEICSDGIDNDCDGHADEDDPDCLTCTDGDGDGFSIGGWIGVCGPVDCDDDDPTVNPEAVEGPYGDPTCSDALDNDCDGHADEDDIESCASECIDDDGDGYGDPATPFCEHPEWDCDDASPSVNPGADEVPDNGIDDDCDGEIDEGNCYISALL